MLVAPGMVRFNWYNPGLTRPAKLTAEALPPTVQTGSVASDPDWLDEPLVRGADGNPKPTAYNVTS